MHLVQKKNILGSVVIHNDGILTLECVIVEERKLYIFNNFFIRVRALLKCLLLI